MRRSFSGNVALMNPPSMAIFSESLCTPEPLGRRPTERTVPVAETYLQSSFPVLNRRRVTVVGFGKGACPSLRTDESSHNGDEESRLHGTANFDAIPWGEIFRVIPVGPDSGGTIRDRQARVGRLRNNAVEQRRVRKHGLLRQQCDDGGCLPVNLRGRLGDRASPWTQRKAEDSCYQE